MAEPTRTTQLLTAAAATVTSIDIELIRHRDATEALAAVRWLDERWDEVEWLVDRHPEAPGELGGYWFREYAEEVGLLPDRRHPEHIRTMMEVINEGAEAGPAIEVSGGSIAADEARWPKPFDWHDLDQMTLGADQLSPAQHRAATAPQPAAPASRTAAGQQQVEVLPETDPGPLAPAGAPAAFMFQPIAVNIAGFSRSFPDLSSALLAERAGYDGLASPRLTWEQLRSAMGLSVTLSRLVREEDYSCIDWNPEPGDQQDEPALQEHDR